MQKRDLNMNCEINISVRSKYIFLVCSSSLKISKYFLSLHFRNSFHPPIFKNFFFYQHFIKNVLKFLNLFYKTFTSPVWREMKMRKENLKEIVKVMLADYRINCRYFCWLTFSVFIICSYYLWYCRERGVFP